MSRAKRKDRLMTGIFYAIGWIMLAFLLYLTLTIIFDGLKGFQWDFLDFQPVFQHYLLSFPLTAGLSANRHRGRGLPG